MLSPGDILDARYEVIAPLAEGGMGAVYRARRTLLGDEVAIKVVLNDLPDGVARERFLRESRIAARLRHPSHRLDPRLRHAARRQRRTW